MILVGGLFDVCHDETVVLGSQKSKNSDKTLRQMTPAEDNRFATKKCVTAASSREVRASSPKKAATVKSLTIQA